MDMLRIKKKKDDKAKDGKDEKEPMKDKEKEKFTEKKDKERKDRDREKDKNRDKSREGSVSHVGGSNNHDRSSGARKDGHQSNSSNARHSAETLNKTCACMTCPEIEVPIEMWQNVQTQKGFLEKKSENSVRWHKRYVVLHGSMLYYYRSSSSKRPVGVLLLDGAKISKVQRVMVEDDEHRLAGWAMQVVTRCGRVAVFSSPNPQERDQWVIAVRQATHESLVFRLHETHKRNESAERTLANIYEMLSAARQDEHANPNAVLATVQAEISSVLGILTGEVSTEDERLPSTDSSTSKIDSYIPSQRPLLQIYQGPTWDAFGAGSNTVVGRKEFQASQSENKIKSRGSHSTTAGDPPSTPPYLDGSHTAGERSPSYSIDGGAFQPRGDRANCTPLSHEDAVKLARLLAQDTECDLLSAIMTTVSRKDQISATLPLVRIFVPQNMFFKLCQWAIEIESSSDTTVAAVLRGEGFAAKLLSQYMRLVGTDYLSVTLGDFLERITSDSVKIQDLELDPMKISGDNKDQILAQNAERLMELSQSLLTAVFQSSVSIPDSSRHIWNYLFAVCRNQLSQKGVSLESAEGQESLNSIGALYFLRYICPAVTDPQRYALASEPPSINARRILILLTKMINNVANGVHFGNKEPHMMLVNEFISRNAQSMRDFYLDLGNMPPGDADVAFTQEWNLAAEKAENGQGPVEDFNPTVLADICVLRELVTVHYKELQTKLDTQSDKMEMLNQLAFLSTLQKEPSTKFRMDADIAL